MLGLDHSQDTCQSRHRAPDVVLLLQWPGVPNTSQIPVVAAVIVRAETYLICQRPLDKRHGGLWEFPGGKLMDGESPLEGATRELREELELQVQAVGEPLLSLKDPGSEFLIMFCPVEAFGDPKALEHIDLRWVKPEPVNDNGTLYGIN